MKPAGSEYTERLIHLQRAWWKRVLDVQAPYRWNLRRLDPGFTLDIGCGIGRNLMHLKGEGVGTDYNPASVEICRTRGLTAFTPENFKSSEFARPNRFDSLLMAHVAEHMTREQLAQLLAEHARYLKPEGRIILITPQEAGYRSDATHVEFMDFDKLIASLRRVGFDAVRAFSFPFPRWAGEFFRYNEFVVVARRAQ